MNHRTRLDGASIRSRNALRERPPHLFSYVLKADTGFAPNPFMGRCTLAACKPIIRRTAQVGDWVVGTGSAHHMASGRVVYAMEVTQKVAFDRYDKGFPMKRPGKGKRKRHGDNIYYRGPSGHYRQRKNTHHGPADMKRDLSGRYVLVSEHFYYLGDGHVRIPPGLRSIVMRGPGHKRIKDEKTVGRFVQWIEGMGGGSGRLGEPLDDGECSTAPPERCHPPC